MHTDRSRAGDGNGEQGRSTSRSRSARLLAVTFALAATMLAATPATDIGDVERGDAHPRGPAAPACERVLDRVHSGPEAVTALGDRLPTVARQNGHTPAELRAALEADPNLHVGECGQLVHVDRPHEQQDHHGPATADDDLPFFGTWEEWDPEPALLASAEVDVLALHSLPDADITIHLEFTGGDGGRLTGAAQAPTGHQFPPFDVDGDPSRFSTEERAAIYEIWARVAEAFSPFEVNVTTDQVSDADLIRLDEQDTRYGVRQLITANPHGLDGVGGVGWQGGTATPILGDPDLALPGGIILTGTGDGAPAPPNIARVIAHELGHNLGLLHHTVPGQNYHLGNEVWAPIMGLGTKAIYQWNNSSYPDATVGYCATNPPGSLLCRTDPQDDLAIMEQSIPLRAADHGSSLADATRLVPGRPESGVIRSGEERHMFRLTLQQPMHIAVTAAPFGPMLDVQLTVKDGSGEQIEVVDPPLEVDERLLRPDGLDVDHDVELPRGTYHLVVEGTGFGDPDDSYADGYPAYGSIGSYTLEVTTACGRGPHGPTPCPTLPPATPTAPGVGAPGGLR